MALLEKVTPDELAGSWVSTALTWLFGGAIGGTIIDTLVKRTGKTSLQELIPDVVKKIPVLGPFINWVAGLLNWGSDKINSGIDYVLNAMGLKTEEPPKPQTQQASSQAASAPQPTVQTPNVPNTKDKAKGAAVGHGQ